MDEVSIDELWRDARDLDAAAALTPRIDRYCSSSRWVLPAQRAFHEEAQPLILRSPAGFAALCRGEAPTIGRYLAALEATWGFACPLLGPDPEQLARDFYRAAMARRERWDALWLGGLDRQGPAFRALARLFSTVASVRLGPVTNRYAARLDGGVEGWLGRRSPHFRANLRRTLRAAARAGVTFERLRPGPGDDPRALFRRVLAVEARSWKGRSESGFNVGGMRVFYELSFDRLVPAGELRLIVAKNETMDLGFIFGGVFHGTYRGLQMSFDEDHRHLGLGNALQSEMISALAEEGVEVYDLGSEIAYKERWADPGISTVTLAVLRG